MAVEGSVSERTFTSPLWPWKRLIYLHYGSKLMKLRIARCSLVRGTWSNILEEVWPCWRRLSLGGQVQSLSLCLFKCELSAISLLGDFWWLREVKVCNSLAGFFLSLAICKLPPFLTRVPAFYLAFSGECTWTWRSDLIWKLSLNQMPDLSLVWTLIIDPC